MIPVCAFYVNKDITKIYKTKDDFILVVNYRIKKTLTKKEVISYVNNIILKDFEPIKKHQAIKAIYDIIDIPDNNQKESVAYKTFIFNKYKFIAYRPI